MIPVGQITVKVCRTGTSAISVKIKRSGTVKDAIAKAGLLKKDSELIQVNGQDADMAKKLKSGDNIVLVKNVAGGLV